MVFVHKISIFLVNLEITPSSVLLQLPTPHSSLLILHSSFFIPVFISCILFSRFVVRYSVSVFWEFYGFCDIFSSFPLKKATKSPVFFIKSSLSADFFQGILSVTHCFTAYRWKSEKKWKKVLEKCCMKGKSRTFALAKHGERCWEKERRFCKFFERMIQAKSER